MSANPTRPSRRVRLIGAGVLVLAWLLALTVCELLARHYADFVLVDGRPLTLVRPHEEFGTLSVETLGGLPVWRRTHPDRPPPRAEKAAFRIVVIGDSVLLPAMLDDRDGMARLLEHELNARLDDGPYEVVNLSEGGWNTKQEEQVLLHEGLALHPDLVLVGVSPNDNREYAYRAGQLFELEFLRELDQRAARGPLAVLARRSYLYNIVWLRWRAIREGAVTPPRQPAELHSIVEPLQRIAERTAAQGGRLAVLCFPLLVGDRFDPAVDRCPFPPLVAWASAAHVPLLDPIAAYAAHPTPDLQLDNIHLSRLGHRVLTRATFDWLVAERLVPYRHVRPAHDAGS